MGDDSKALRELRISFELLLNGCGKNPMTLAAALVNLGRHQEH
jgi:hypothetical protein